MGEKGFKSAGNSMMTLLAFIVTIGILVVIHEYGHFQVARWCDVKVLKFSVGFGKPLWTKRFGKDNTELVIASIPLGGYVKMLDERELEQEGAMDNYQGIQLISADDLPRAFNRKPVYQRIAIVLAGPVANLLLAIFIYWLLFMMGLTGIKPIVGEVKPSSATELAGLETGDMIQVIDGKTVNSWQDARWILLEKSLEADKAIIQFSNKDNTVKQTTLYFTNINSNPEVDILERLGLSMFKPLVPAVIGEVLENSAANQAGLKQGDKIISIDNIKMQDWEAVVSYVKVNPNQSLLFKIQRDNNTFVTNITPDETVQNGERIGRIGVGVQLNKALQQRFLVELKYTPVQSLQLAVQKTWQTALFSLKMLWNMVIGKSSWKGISGPGTIASFAGESANLGIKVFLSFLALVSISIGVLNLLPIPMLDGGHLMYYIVEIFKGSPVSDQVMLLGQKVGMGLLGMLMVVAIFNDINRFVFGI